MAVRARKSVAGNPRNKPKARPRRPATTCAACARRLRRLEAEHQQELERRARQLAAVRRAADRRLTAMMQEIALLRHHQARVDALERLLAERDGAGPAALGGSQP